MRDQQGFTLVELLVVFAILALLVGAVPVAFERMRDSAQYRDTLRSMLSDLKVARERAVTQGQEVRFRIDLRNRTYGVHDQAQRALPESLQIKAVVASKEVRPDGVAAILFLPGGGATGGTVEVIRPSGGGTRLQVDWLTGRVTQETLSRSP